MRFAAIVLVGLLTASLPACSGDEPDAQFQRELRAAEKQARAQLPWFWERFSAPTETEYDFLVRAEIAASEDVERREEVWIEVISRTPSTGAIEGALASEPEILGMSRGDRVSLDEKDVIDWAFFSGMQLLGHYTTRVRLPAMPPDQAEALRSLLGENPS